MLRLGFPEGADGRHFRYDLAWPEDEGLDIRDRILRDALLLVVHIDNGRPFRARRRCVGRKTTAARC
jgi:hypothetical protein